MFSTVRTCTRLIILLVNYAIDLQWSSRLQYWTCIIQWVCELGLTSHKHRNVIRRRGPRFKVSSEWLVERGNRTSDPWVSSPVHYPLHHGSAPVSSMKALLKNYGKLTYVFDLWPLRVTLTWTWHSSKRMAFMRCTCMLKYQVSISTGSTVMSMWP